MLAILSHDIQLFTAVGTVKHIMEHRNGQLRSLLKYFPFLPDDLLRFVVGLP